MGLIENSFKRANVNGKYSRCVVSLFPNSHLLLNLIVIVGECDLVVEWPLEMDEAIKYASTDGRLKYKYCTSCLGDDE